MSNLTPNQRECALIIIDLIESEITLAQRNRLNELCREDLLCRKLYTAAMSVHGMLLWSSDLSAKREEVQGPDAFLLEIYEEARISRIKLDAEVELAKNMKAETLGAKEGQSSVDESKKSPLILTIPKAAVYSGLAAAIVLALVLLWPLTQSTSPATGPNDIADIAQERPKAQLVRANDASWSPPISLDGSIASDETWTLKQGFAEIVMPSGASVILHGPTTFRILDENKLALDHGRLTAEVPDRAKYFTVKTKTMDVVDLGTRFGVSIEGGGATKASVFEGKVEVNEPISDPHASPRKVALSAGQEIGSDANGRLDNAIATVQPDHGYVTRWDDINRRVLVQGQARFFSTPPASVRLGELGSTNNIIVFEESTVVLDQPLTAMVNLPEKRSAATSALSSGLKAVSYFLHTEPDAADASSHASATLTFPGRILGVIGDVKQLRETNDLLGLETVRYIPVDQEVTHGIDPGSPDHFAIGGLQGNVLTIHLAAGRFADQARVIVEIPE